MNLENSLVMIDQVCCICGEDILEDEGVHTSLSGEDCHDYCCDVCCQEHHAHAPHEEYELPHVLDPEAELHTTIEVVDGKPFLKRVHPGTNFTYYIPFSIQYTDTAVLRVADTLLQDYDLENITTQIYVVVHKLALDLVRIVDNTRIEEDDDL